MPMRTLRTQLHVGIGPTMWSLELPTLTTFKSTTCGTKHRPLLNSPLHSLLCCSQEGPCSERVSARSMGNCMYPAAAPPRQMEEEEEEEETGPEKGDEGGGCKVKILMTRKELEWLVLHLKEKGEQRLEDVLVEMSREMEKKKRNKGRVEGWKPTLESIVETSELQIA